MNIKTSDFQLLNFQPGSRRGLARTLSKVLAQNGEDDSSKQARDFVIMLPEDFTRKDVEGLLTKLIDQDSNATKPLSKPEPAIKEKTGTSINSQARELLLSGKTVTEVSKALNKSYQRIKNIQKLMSQEDKTNS